MFLVFCTVSTYHNTSQEDARQKKSKSSVRQDIFGDQKPRSASVSTGNKKHNVKTKANAPPPPGSGRKATKTEIWNDPGEVFFLITYNFPNYLQYRMSLQHLSKFSLNIFVSFLDT